MSKPDTDETLQSWREILAVALDTFFLKPPQSILEGLRRMAVVCVLLMLSGGTYLLVRQPEVLGAILGKPIEERSITERMEVAGEKAARALEGWFYSNSPKGLMLIAWDELATLRGVWVKPELAFADRIGVRQLAEEMREWAGPFVFGECVVQDYPELPGMHIAACPIITTFDVWGYVAVVYDSSTVSDARALKALQNLTRELTEILY